MNVATKLRGAFALYIALLAAVLLYHVRTIRESVKHGHALTATSSRLRSISNNQLGRVAEMSNTAEKYLVTRDRGYLDKLTSLIAAYGAELRRLQALALSDEERAALAPLARRWTLLEEEARSLGADSGGPPSAALLDAVARLELTLDEIHVTTQQLAEAAQAAMNRQLADSETTARSAERVSWMAALAALLLSVVLSALLVRSIVRPLERLTLGTREISAGRFGYRLQADGEDELSQVAREFNAMTARLDELDRMKRDFVSNVSHDLKTPLSSMQETTAVLLDELPGPLSEKQRRLLLLNQEGGLRLASMIAKLLDIARLESAPAARRLEVMDVMQVARHAVDRANATRPGENPSVLLAHRDTPALVRGDSDGLLQVLDNLLENALKFSPADGTVRVAVAEQGDSVLLSVADEGPGIPDADKEKVFERFYQTRAGRAVAARGVGLGLAICKQIVTAHGGAIRVEDNTPGGSIFQVVLPGVSATAAMDPRLAVESAA
jgi:signal transduction histidine kinase